MANTIRDYSATPANNTVVDGADISEGCSPAGINDAIRGVMADLKDVSTGAVALESPAADSLSVTGNVSAATFSGDGSSLTGIPTPTLTSLGIANHDQVTVTSGGAVTATSYAGDGSALTGLGGGFPSGTKMLFGQTTAPTGWTKITTNNDAALRIVSGTVGSGGSSGLSTALATPSVTGTISGSTGSHTLSTSQMPSHTHTQNAAYYDQNANTISPNKLQAYRASGQSANTYTIANYTSSSTGGGGSHSHSLSATFSGGTAAINVKYVDVIMASKD
jgi:hypothetical protein